DSAMVLVAGPDLPFEVIDHHLGEIDAGEALRAAEAAGREHVDLHELVSDDVQADEEHAVLHELRADDFNDAAHGVSDLALMRLPARAHVAARLSLGADATEGGAL